MLFWFTDTDGRCKKSWLPESYHAQKQRWAVRGELNKIRGDGRLDNASPPLLECFRGNTAIWSTNVNSNQKCYMCVSATPFMNDQRYVLMVNTRRFYEAWLSNLGRDGSNRRGLDCVLKSQMPSDYKYKNAAEGFSLGIDNPVPLAEVSATEEVNGHDIRFGNGVTRTKWLIANDAESFPIEVRYEETALIIHGLAGFQDVMPCTVAELLKIDAAFY